MIHCSRKEKGLCPLLSPVRTHETSESPAVESYALPALARFFFQPGELRWHTEDCTTPQRQHQIRKWRLLPSLGSLPLGKGHTQNYSSSTQKTGSCPLHLFFNSLIGVTSSSGLNPAGRITWRSAAPIYQLGLL